IPLIWPALLAAALLAWTQALTWMPYGLPGIRLIVAVLCLAALDTVVLLAIHFKAGEPRMVAILAPQVPLAYLVARFAVARARRGDVPDWRGLSARSGEIADVLPRPRNHFSSPGCAQVWFGGRRRLASAELIGAKLKMAMWGTLAAWLLVFVTTPLALAWSGTWSVLMERAQRMNDAIGTPRAVAFVLLILAGFIVSTWKQLVQSLHIVLTGRAWLIKGSVLLTLTFLILLEIGRAHV